MNPRGNFIAYVQRLARLREEKKRRIMNARANINPRDVAYAQFLADRQEDKKRLTAEMAVAYENAQVLAKVWEKNQEIAEALKAPEREAERKQERPRQLQEIFQQLDAMHPRDLNKVDDTGELPLFRAMQILCKLDPQDPRCAHWQALIDKLMYERGADPQLVENRDPKPYSMRRGDVNDIWCHCRLINLETWRLRRYEAIPAVHRYLDHIGLSADSKTVPPKIDFKALTQQEDEEGRLAIGILLNKLRQYPKPSFTYRHPDHYGAVSSYTPEQTDFMCSTLRNFFQHLTDAKDALSKNIGKPYAQGNTIVHLMIYIYYQPFPDDKSLLKTPEATKLKKEIKKWLPILIKWFPELLTRQNNSGDLPLPLILRLEFHKGNAFPELATLLLQAAPPGDAVNATNQRGENALFLYLNHATQRSFSEDKNVHLLLARGAKLLANNNGQGPNITSVENVRFIFEHLVKDHKETVGAVTVQSLFGDRTLLEIVMENSVRPLSFSLPDNFALMRTLFDHSPEFYQSFRNDQGQNIFFKFIVMATAKETLDAHAFHLIATMLLKWNIPLLKDHQGRGPQLHRKDNNRKNFQMKVIDVMVVVKFFMEHLAANTSVNPTMLTVNSLFGNKTLLNMWLMAYYSDVPLEQEMTMVKKLDVFADCKQLDLTLEDEDGTLSILKLRRLIADGEGDGLINVYQKLVSQLSNNYNHMFISELRPLFGDEIGKLICSYLYPIPSEDNVFEAFNSRRPQDRKYFLEHHSQKFEGFNVYHFAVCLIMLARYFKVPDDFYKPLLIDAAGLRGPQNLQKEELNEHSLLVEMVATALKSTIRPPSKSADEAPQQCFFFIVPTRKRQHGVLAILDKINERFVIIDSQRNHEGGEQFAVDIVTDARRRFPEYRHYPVTSLLGLGNKMLQQPLDSPFCIGFVIVNALAYLLMVARIDMNTFLHPHYLSDTITILKSLTTIDLGCAILPTTQFILMLKNVLCDKIWGALLFAYENAPQELHQQLAGFPKMAEETKATDAIKDKGDAKVGERKWPDAPPAQAEDRKGEEVKAAVVERKDVVQVDQPAAPQNNNAPTQQPIERKNDAPVVIGREQVRVRSNSCPHATPLRKLSLLAQSVVNHPAGEKKPEAPAEQPSGSFVANPLAPTKFRRYSWPALPAPKEIPVVRLDPAIAMRAPGGHPSGK